MSDTNGQTPRFTMPTANKFSGTTFAKVVAFKSVTSRFNTPQIEFTFLTEKGNRFTLWCSINSENHVNTFLAAGILRAVGSNEFEIVPLGTQPRLKVTMNEGKLVKFEKP